MRTLPPPPPGARPAPPAGVPAGRRRGWLLYALLLGLVAWGFGLLGVLVGARLVDDDDGRRPPREASAEVLDVAARRDDALPRIDVAAISDIVGPSVVTISADISRGSQVGASVGSGIITTSDGEIVTNAHVVDGATTIRVRLPGEIEPRDATLLASDAGNDLALLRISGEDLPAVTFADPESVRIGDEVVAIGFALDLDGEPSVTLGIVSAIGRTITTPDNTALNGLIQTDAAISSGNSGGPLVNAAGEVVGINTAVARGNATTAASNVGFAISSGEALPVIGVLRDRAGGEARVEGYLGVGLADRTDGGQGARITEVQPGTPADDAGLEVGDIVIAVGDATVDGTAGLVAAIRDREPGDDLSLVVWRDGDSIDVDVTLAARPDES